MTRLNVCSKDSRLEFNLEWWAAIRAGNASNRVFGNTILLLTRFDAF